MGLSGSFAEWETLEHGGAALAAVPPWYFSRVKTPHQPWVNPMRTWKKVAIGFGVVTVVLVGTAGVAWARARPRQLAVWIPSEDDAITAALDQSGPDAPVAEIAAAAYFMAYPDGPSPPTGGHLVAWNRIVHKIRTQLGRPEEGALEIPEAEDVDDTAELVGAWLASLTPAQEQGARSAIGSGTWDPVVQGAARNDDRATKAALLSLKVGIEHEASENKLGALKMYSDLKSLLGPKLDEFIGILDQTVGKPEVA